MSKQSDLDKLQEKMKADDMLPLKKGATRLVFGVGDANTKILFIGEGPGYWEDQKGEPFVGNAGKLLDRLLLSIKLPRESVYITNVVHHRPPNNRDPEPSEMTAYGKYLDEIIRIINPKVVVSLGRFSMGKFLPGARISSVHGSLNKLKWKGTDLIMVPMYHPAAALRNGDIMRAIQEDFLKLSEAIEIASEEKLEQASLI